MSEIELPHGVWYDSEVGCVTVPIDRFTISFTPEEYVAFVGALVEASLALRKLSIPGDEDEEDADETN